MTTPTARVFLRHDAGGWRVAAAATGSLIVEYRQFEGPWPSQVRINSAPGRTPQIDVSFDAQPDRDQSAPLEPSVFSLAVPADAVPLTLQQLRDAGPLGEKK